ncbi:MULTISPECIES: RNA polymerase sigma factor [Streptacidiphilus]|uniref:RNA polymerase sigma factor n=1 Tax=Streptacidiphilus cavernicola TaxID=3342716 RepID=A0ABV6URU9_9ACTN|nr:sigma-70 family RNA polymerase sigma factor [Streptacidiphilus jeojiense]
MDVDAQVDVDLVQAARGGEVAAVGLLIERHGAGMRAVAVSLLGPGADVEDVLQDAALIALRRVAEVRDPEAVGAWLRMVVRNCCRALLRQRRAVGSVGEWVPVPDDAAHPERWLERNAMRDWVWEAVERLSPTLRLPLVLRHFSEGVTSYDDIARACGVPVGTVRSRLSQARARLCEELAGIASAAHGDASGLAEASRRQAGETLAAAEQGRFEAFVAERWTADVDLYVGAQRLGGRELLVRGMEGDLADGVRQRPVNIVASRL